MTVLCGESMEVSKELIADTDSMCKPQRIQLTTIIIYLPD